MQNRVINGQQFVATKRGKRDVFEVPTKVIQDAHARADQATRIIESLRQSEQAVQQRLEAATLTGDSTESIRAELQAVADEIRDAERDASEAHSVINQVHELVDAHTAAAIQKADSERLDATMTSFTNFLKDNT